MSYKFNPFTGSFDDAGAASGANVTLSNLGVTAVNAALTLDGTTTSLAGTANSAMIKAATTANAFAIQTPTLATNVSSKTIEIRTGNGLGTASTGDISITTGVPFGAGQRGNVTLSGGRIQPGDQNLTNLGRNDGNYFKDISGARVLGPIDRNLKVESVLDMDMIHAAGQAINFGNIRIRTDHPDGNWGSAGSAIEAFPVNPGDYSALSLRTSDSSDGDWTSDIRLKVGDSTGTGGGGGINLEGGNAINNNTTDITLQAGNSTNQSAGGLTLQAGQGGINGGGINIIGGQGGSGNGGGVSIYAGENTALVRSDINVLARSMNLILGTLLGLGNVATASLPVTAANGTLVYDTTTNELLVWKNGSWRTVTTS